MNTVKSIAEFLGSVAIGSVVALLGGLVLVAVRVSLTKRRRRQVESLRRACHRHRISYLDAAAILLSDDAAETGISEKAKEVRNRMLRVEQRPTRDLKRTPDGAA